MDFHFSYQGQCKITADSYEEARQQLSQRMLGVYSYRNIHPTCSMLATPSEVFSDDEEDDFILDEVSEMSGHPTN